MSDRHLFAWAVVLYGISMIYSIFLWRKGFRQDNRINYLVLAAAFGLHTLAMVKRGFSLSQCPVNNLYEALTFVMWTIVAVYLVVGLWSRLRFLGAFASPILFAIGVFALMPALDTPYKPHHPEFHNDWRSVHATMILLSYGAFGLSCVAGLMYLMQDHDLKYHKLRAVISLLPSIQRLDAMIGRLLVAGFALLTVGLACSPFLMKEVYGVYFKPDPKILWSIFVWGLYCTLVVVRWRFHQGGRRVAWGAVASFAFVLLTFWGFDLLSSIHHP